MVSQVPNKRAKSIKIFILKGLYHIFMIQVRNDFRKILNHNKITFITNIFMRYFKPHKTSDFSLEYISKKFIFKIFICRFKSIIFLIIII